MPMKVGRKSLSSDCWEAIFSYLGDEDVKAVSLTCKDFLAYSNPLKKSLKVVHPGIDMLCRHLNRFKHLKTIDLLEFEGDVKEAIRVIARSGIELEALRTEFHHAKILFEINRYLFEIRGVLFNFGSPNIVFDGVCLSELCSNLKACTFGGRLVDSDFGLIADRYPNLEDLRVEKPSFSKIVSGPGLQLLASKLRVLKKIYLPSCYVSDQFIVALSLNCVFLKEVTVVRLSNVDQGDQGNHGVTENAVAQLLQNRPNLEALLIEYIVKGDSVSQSSLSTIEESISHAKALTSLVVGGMSNTDKVLMAIAKAKLQLNNLGLIACRDLTVSGLLLVLSDHLTKLRIESASLTDEDMKLLLTGDVGKLTHIEINECPVSKSTFFLLSARCPSLTHVILIFTDTMFRLGGGVRNVPIPLSKNRKIQSLCLENWNGFHIELAKQFGCLFPNLKVLDLNACYPVTTKHIQAILKGCKHVTELYLVGFQEAKMIAEDDSEFPELNLEVLKLSCSKINDEGLAVIAKKCPRLVSLDLDRCEGITIEGLKQVVGNIKTLTRLNLVNSCGDNFGALLGWMLSTGNLASLKRIILMGFTKEERDLFLGHGCLLLSWWWQ